MVDLHKFMRAAFEANDGVAMFEVFQIAHSEMPEAIKTLERILKRVLEDGQIDAEESTMALSTSHCRRRQENLTACLSTLVIPARATEKRTPSTPNSS